MNDAAQAQEHTAIPVLYDETHRAISFINPVVGSICTIATLIGYLEHHAPNTDGSFAICVAGGDAIVVSKLLYESIPEQHRPPLDISHAGQEVSFLGDIRRAIGSTIMPVVLTDATTGRKFCIKICALVMKTFSMGMFIGQAGSRFIESSYWFTETVLYDMDFGNGNNAQVVYELRT